MPEKVSLMAMLSPLQAMTEREPMMEQMPM